MMTHPTGIPQEYQNIVRYFVPVHMSENYYCIICCCCNCVAQVPKTKVKKKRLEKNVFILYGENGREELHPNPNSDFQTNIFKFQHS